MAKRSKPSPRTAPPAPLAGRVAIVAGATRGAGRGIARALGEAGAIVYCTGRSVTSNPSPYGRPETIDETAQMIEAAGGTAIPLRVDHSIEAEVEALFHQVDREQGRLDILVDSVGGEDPLMGPFGWFWTADLTNAAKALENSLLSHVITAKHAALAMMRAGRGLIVEVTENNLMGAGGNPVGQIVKLALKGQTLNWAAELHPHGVAIVAITPGFLRSESMLEHFGITEKNWRDGGKKDKNFLESESPLYVGRAVAALAQEPRIMKRTGQLFSSWELAREYKFTDVDGRRPDWGTLKIDFGKDWSELLEYIRTGHSLQLQWLETVTKRAKSFSKQLPKQASRGKPGPTASAKATTVRRSPTRGRKNRTRPTKKRR